MFVDKGRRRESLGSMLNGRAVLDFRRFLESVLRSSPRRDFGEDRRLAIEPDYCRPGVGSVALNDACATWQLNIWGQRVTYASIIPN